MIMIFIVIIYLYKDIPLYCSLKFSEHGYEINY